MHQHRGSGYRPRVKVTTTTTRQRENGDDMNYTTETQARDAGEIVFRAHNGAQAWCLCGPCTTKHASANKRRTRHDRWAINGQDWRIRGDLARRAA